ncbi:MAG: RNA polymerase sigma factor [Gammaproteobacteria bacterium]|uniref:Sigma-24 (FecI-like) protein n=1 Tax=Marinobacter nitratireducens TaxID=1137280 RepID=A0A072MX64_9GAMM|nr:RNA polymerase sigma factor [Marinobacter nitratireducens]KEF30004.1 sigma-24 (FecI-like) protein [Marinobacter nitratireducens]TNE74168.1 MAG: RNA polymerase sigma factor [Gammaproteobacteria bacterium]
MALLPFRQSKSKRFENLIQPHLQPMYNYAYRLTGRSHDAEDLVQEVVTKLFPKLEEMEQVSQLRPWIARVLYRQFIDNIRKRPAGREMNASALDNPEHPTSYLESLESAAPDPLGHTEGDQRSELLKQVIGELQPDQRTLLLLHDSDGWRQEDIAEILEVPIGTIKSRLHRVRALVRTKFQERLEPFEEQLRDSH